MTVASPEALVKELDLVGLLPAKFGPLLHAVRRQWFIPDRIWVDDEPLDRNGSPDAWMSAVYSNKTIVTQFDDGDTAWPNVGDRPTCSASMPSTVVGMLNELDVRSGDSVLEIGTGTGFNAALLSKLVGKDGSVSSLEIDYSLTHGARLALDKANFPTVRVVNEDGHVGLKECAPFDRVIATAAVQLGRIPYAWVEQAKPGGIILAPIRADLTPGPLVRFEVDHDGTARGRMVPMGVAFMELRSQRSSWVGRTDFDPDGEIHQTTTDIKPWLMFSDFVSRWALAVAMPSCRYEMEENEFLWLRDPVSGSWAHVVPNEHRNFVVTQQGCRRLWDQAVNAYKWWQDQGKPLGPDWEWVITKDAQSIRIANP